MSTIEFQQLWRCRVVITLLAACQLGLTDSPEAAAAQIVTGAGSGSLPHVKAFDDPPLPETSSFLAYSPTTLGGVRVAAGDINGDGAADFVTSVGDGSAPHVKVFSGVDQAELRSFFAYSPSFLGGVNVAAADVDGDDFADIVTGSGLGGSSHIKTFSGASGAEIHSFFAFPGVVAEVRVAAGDVNGDGKADIITGLGPGSGPHVKVFDGANLELLYSFFAYDTTFAHGIYVASGDINGDGLDDIITGTGEGGATVVRVFSGNGTGELGSFIAYPSSDAYEVRVAAADINADGRDDIITGLGPSPAAGPHVKVFNGSDLSVLRDFFAYDLASTSGVYVAGYSAVPEPSSMVLAGLALMFFSLHCAKRHAPENP